MGVSDNGAALVAINGKLHLYDPKCLILVQRSSSSKLCRKLMHNYNIIIIILQVYKIILYEKFGGI